MSEATVTSKGRITIPADIRKSMRLVAGMCVVFTRLDDGTTVMRAKTRSILELRGLLKPAPNSVLVTIDEMNIGRD
jgi:AbrB family looped-hinge helix DNA binding protein